MESKIVLEVPEEFPFPFIPYSIQVDFMKNLYSALEGGKFGIFESPTGTGKSMSVICGSLRWLHDHEQRMKDELEKMVEHDEAANKKAQQSSDDWIADFTAKKQVEDERKDYKDILEQRLKKEAKLTELRNKARPSVSYKRKFSDLDKEFHELFKDLPKDENSNRLVDECEEEDASLVLEEYHSDEEKTNETEHGDDDDEVDDEHVTKIYFCSRTHSQLAQFVREVKRSPYAENTRVITLASRQNTCINDAVLKLRSLSLINERCLDMQKNKGVSKSVDQGKRRKLAAVGGKCPYYKQENIYDLRDKLLVDVVDVEESVTVGRRMNACPYYANRYAVPAAQLVALPYNVLLHRKTREAFGIKLKGQIVIVDEAHNLVETINNAYSVHVSLSQFTRAHSQLAHYMGKYASRLLAKNLLYVRQILFVLESCVKLLKTPTDGAPKQTSVRLASVLDFVNDLNIDNINLFKVLKYCQKSQISRKLHGYVEKYRPPLEAKKVETKPEPSGLQKYLEGLKAKNENVTETETVDESSEKREENAVMSSPLMHIESFLEALTSTSDDGRILIAKHAESDRSSLKFLLMNPAVHFRSVVEEARAVIVAGGTMQPVSEFKDQLCSSTGIQPERILEFSCGHVIPPQNLLPVALSTGPSGQLLDFTYQNRDRPKLVDELGRVVQNICRLVPGGVVVFFPSYEYENKVVEHWRTGGTMDRIARCKDIFREPRKNTLCDSVLKSYTKTIQQANSKGAILLCVVGGKMSEGINFSDELGRCILMVGLPYPNRFSPELKEKMNYLNSHYPKSDEGRSAGQVHYENLCMKAVNQSIGRAIRHRDDYASILLLDQRYLRAGVVAKLPSWIASNVVKYETFGPALGAVGKFFAGKKKTKAPA